MNEHQRKASLNAYQLRKEQREHSGRKRSYFDLSQHARDLLKRTSVDQHIPQTSLLELMIRRYCDPNTYNLEKQRSERSDF